MDFWRSRPWSGWEPAWRRSSRHTCRWIQESLLPLAIDDGRAWIFLTVPTGFFIAWLIAKRFAPEVSGDGVPQAVAALEVQGWSDAGASHPVQDPGHGGHGGNGWIGRSGGPDRPDRAAIGSVISKRFNLGEDQVRSLVAAGAGAGIGATFNAPIAGMLFALEVILSSFAARHMSAIVIASVTAAITTQTLVGSELAISAGVYRLGSPLELLLYAGLAILVVAVGIVFLRLVGGLERFVRARERSLGLLRPIVSGSARGRPDLCRASGVRHRPGGDQSDASGRGFRGLVGADRCCSGQGGRQRSHSQLGGVRWGLHAVVVHGLGTWHRIRPLIGAGMGILQTSTPGPLRWSGWRRCSRWSEGPRSPRSSSFSR